MLASRAVFSRTLLRTRAFSSNSATTVGVVGLGLMGHGIAQVAAEKGFDVVAVELEDKFLAGGMSRIEGSVQKLASKAVAKGKMSEDVAKDHVAGTLGRIRGTTDRGELGSCDIIVEAVRSAISASLPRTPRRCPSARWPATAAAPRRCWGCTFSTLCSS